MFRVTDLTFPSISPTINEDASANQRTCIPAMGRCCLFTLISFTSHLEFLLRYRLGHAHTIEPVPPYYFPTWSHADPSKSNFRIVERRSSSAPSSSAPSAALTTSLYRRTCRTCEADPRRRSKTVQSLASNRRKCPQRCQEHSGTRRSRVGFRGVLQGRHNCTREDSCTP
jgi:hypothetical protein